MPTRHVVEQGECLSTIARAFGFGDWHTIYEDASNADLRALRPNPNVLFPGDVVNIPDKNVVVHDLPTNARHRFVVAREVPRLRTRIIGPDGEAFANRPFTLDLGGAQTSGQTDGDGLIDQPVPPGTTTADLTIQVDDEAPPHTLAFKLHLGALDPVAELTGAQARLKNLGYDPGPIDGVLGDLTRAALTAFQLDQSLAATAELDDDTKSALTTLHDEAS